MTANPCRMIEKIIHDFNEHLGLERKISVQPEKNGITVKYGGRTLLYSSRGKLVGVSNEPTAS